MESYIFQLHNIVQNKAFPCVFTAMSFSTFACFLSVCAEDGHGLTISVLKYIYLYIYNFSFFLQNVNKNAGRSIQYEGGRRSS